MRTLRWAAPVLLCVAALAACSAGGPAASPESGPATDHSAPPPEAGSPAAAGKPGTDTAGAAGKSRTVQGVWASADGVLRLTLRPDGTFSEDYNGTENAYEGRYTLRGDALTLSARTGESAGGTVGTDRIVLSGRALLPQQ